MQENSFSENADDIEELLKQYEDLRNGRKVSFLEEESFEILIEYFNEKMISPKPWKLRKPRWIIFPIQASFL